MHLTNKNIVIIGASRGLGRETALRLGQNGANLILIARSENLLEKIQKEIKILTGSSPLIIPLDISDEAKVNNMAMIIAQKFKHIDILINNAGFGIHKPSLKITGSEMRSLFEVNFYGAYYCIRALLPLLRGSTAGYILNIGSLVSEIAFADNSVYAATKAALSAYSSGLSRELKPFNINTGIFLPGLMATSFQDDREKESIPGFLFLDPEKVARKIEKMIDKKKKKIYMHRWMLYLMRLRKIFT